METADYCLQGYEDACLIERKKDLFEIFKNVIDPTGRRRFIAELKRLNDECQTPFILFEGAPKVLTGAKSLKHASGLTPNDLVCARDCLLDLLLSHRISYAILPTTTLLQRRAAAEWTIATLIAGANHATRRPE